MQNAKRFFWGGMSLNAKRHSRSAAEKEQGSNGVDKT